MGRDKAADYRRNRRKLQRNYGYHPPKRKKNQGCYVATCIYGSYDCEEVWTLRRYRDYTLESSWYGRLFIKAYYCLSPKAVDLFGNCNWFHKMIKPLLDKMVEKLKKEGYSSEPYEDN